MANIYDIKCVFSMFLKGGFFMAKLGRPELSQLDKNIRGQQIRVQLNKLQDVQLNDYAWKSGLPLDVVVKNAINMYLETLIKTSAYMPSYFATREFVNLEIEKLIFADKFGREMSEQDITDYYQRVADIKAGKGE